MEAYKENEECMSSTEGSDPGEDSDMDPDYCYLEEKLSELTIRSKSKSRCSTAKDQEENVKDFELVQKIIEGGEVEKLKLEQCKVYLRKNGLRLTGNKSTLIERIKEHLEISNGGEKKYPVSSFVLDCKGDACTGDVVMFEQNVYEMFNIASGSANGPPCGKRMVAGRIVKESYGAAKQQHTFTIEVLWSKGAKPLPPLHPLLIKGRNLYRLQTLRQRWEDEGKRCKVLMEKHARGSQARSHRETRIHEKEVRRQHKANRVLMEGPKRNQSQLNVQSQEKAETLIDDDHKQLAQHLVKNAGFREVQYRRDENFHANHRQPDLALRSHQPPISMYGMDSLSERTNYIQPLKSRGHHYPQTSCCRQPLKSSDHCHHPKSPPQSPIHKYSCTNGQSFQNICSPTHQAQKQGWMKQKLCHFYPRGRCYYGDNCKFWHELSQGCDQTWPGTEPERTNCIQLLKSRDNHYPQTSPCRQPLKSRDHHYPQMRPCRQPLKSSGHYHPLRSPPRSPIHKYSCTNDGQSFQNVCSPTRQSQKQGWMEQKLCQFYPRGRCYYGDNCKFLHDL